MKQLQTIPEYICPAGEENFSIYTDTDSVYVKALPILRYLYPDFDEKTDDVKDDLLEKTAIKFQDVLNDHYQSVATDIFNCKDHRLEMKTECVIRSAYFRSVRRYAQWITREEHIKNEYLSFKGLEYMKTNFPKYFSEFFYGIMKQALKGIAKEEIDQKILDFKKRTLSKETDIVLLGNPTAVNTMDDYVERKPKPGELFTPTTKGALASVKAALRYNDLLRYWGLDKKHSFIAQGDKIKWIYLKDNPYKIDAIAFLDFDIPDKVRTFMNEYADREKIFESVLLKKLQGFYGDIGWVLNLNPHSSKFFTF
jgi:hypothetical protein